MSTALSKREQEVMLLMLMEGGEARPVSGMPYARVGDQRVGSATLHSLGRYGIAKEDSDMDGLRWALTPRGEQLARLLSAAVADAFTRAR